MSTQFYQRPSAGYTGESGLPNRTKYNDDSTASPRRPISSTKLDGDINYLIDAVNALYDTAVSGVVADNSITDAKLRDSAGLSVIGRSANTTGNPADIVAASDDQVLRRSGTSIGFGQIATAGIADSAITAVKIADTNVTFAKVQNVNTSTILGRTSSGAGPVEALTVGAGLVLGSGTLDTALQAASAAEVQTGTATNRALTPDAFRQGAIVYSSVVNTTSGTQHDITSIPSWAKRITLAFNGVSTNGTSNVLVQVGAGAMVSSGYTSTGSVIFGTNSCAVTTSTVGFVVNSASAASARTGHMLIMRQASTNNYICSHTVIAGSDSCTGGGSVGLSGDLDRVRVTTVNGTDTFDAGSIVVSWE